MASRIITKKGSGAPLASDLVHGELAVDTVNKRLYTENAGGTIIELGTAPSTIDINSGTIDGTVIGGSSAAAGTFTSITGTSANINGTVTADGLTVDGDIEISDATEAKLTMVRSGVRRYDVTVDGSANFTIADNALGDRFKIASNGDISFYEDTGTTAKFFWDASAEGLSIGTTSNLGGASLDVVSNATSSFTARSASSGAGTTVKAVRSVDSSASNFANAQYDALSHAWILSNSTQAMTLDSSGNVGIGISPQSFAKLQVKTATNRNVSIFDNAAGPTVGAITDAGASTSLRVAGSNLIFTGGGGAGAEHMRLDTSGNLLVGKTTSDVNTAGGEIRSHGGIVGSRDGSWAAAFNRKTSDGEIVGFYKDGTTVGSIGSRSGVASTFILDPRASGTGISAAGVQLWPTNESGTVSNGANDLGGSSARWKDLYLSGGVYLGGTGAANKLDDYETGTFTPTVGGTWLTNPTSLAGRYTKIGDLVYISITFANGVKASATAGWLAGLPFSIVYNGTGSCVDSAVENQGLCLFSNTGRIWLTDNSFTASSVTVTGCYKA